MRAVSDQHPQSFALRWLPLLGMLALCPPLWAAPLLQQLDGAVRDVFTTSNGLPHNTVNALAQTADGYLWVATWEGLVRYNGREFTAFDRRHVRGWPDDGVRALHVAPDGSLWVGTARGGLAQRVGEGWYFPAPARGLVTAIESDAHGRIWIATESNGIERIEADGTRRHLDAQPGSASNASFDLHRAADGALYAATAAGLLRVHEDRVERLSGRHGLPAGSVFSIDDDGAGGLLLGAEAGAWHWPAQGAARPLALPWAAAISQVVQLEDDERYFGSVQHGLLRQWQGRWDRLGSADGLPNQRVASLLRDRENNLWLGSNRGLVRLRDAPIVTLTRRHGLRDDFVRSVLPAAEGRLWVGTSLGLSRLRGAVIDTPDWAEQLAGESILALSHADSGDLWVGTFASGLLKVGPQGVLARLDRGSGLASNEVRAVRDEGEELWVGTTLGLNRIDGGGVATFGQDQGLPGYFISALARSTDGSLWVGTATGLGRIHGERVERVDLSGHGDPQFIFGMLYEPEADLLWLATDRGLLRHHPSSGRWDAISLAQGLPVEKVFQPVIDRSGAFWLSSNRGIMRIPPGAIQALLDGRRRQLDALLLGESDGMATAQCNGGSSLAGALGSDGTVWFATALGVAGVAAEAALSDASQPPRVVIESLSADGRALATQRAHQLPPQVGRVAMQFAGLSFLTPEWIRYRTRLHGYDEGWIERGTQRQVEYTNLAPGRYRFEVQAANPDSAWSEPASVQFSVSAQLWQRPAFWVTLVTLAVAVLWLGLRMRFERLRRRERKLRQLVDERTRDLRQQTERLLQLAREREQLVERLRQQADAFERQAREDGLTGLLNRRGFDEALQQALAEDHGPLSLVLIDLDHFKQINDRHSHAAGDRVLVEVAELLRRRLPEARVARWGGEEFAALLPGIDQSRAGTAVDTLRQQLQRSPAQQIAPALQLSFSAGIAERRRGETGESLLQRADAALYRAKAGGRDRIEYGC
jgi:diguanylate cyclase (GGDEF)-like protein